MSNDIAELQQQIAAVRELVLARQAAPPAEPERGPKPAERHTKAKAKPRARTKPVAKPRATVPDLSTAPKPVTPELPEAVAMLAALRREREQGND